MISGFTHDYFFLSNFYYAPMIINSLEYATVEHYYQSKKTDNMIESEHIRLAETPKEAKQLGRKCALKNNWNSDRIVIMRRGLEQKFYQNKDLKEKLIATGDKELIEFNHWGDTFWGVTSRGGENNLGILLMQIRKKYQK